MGAGRTVVIVAGATLGAFGLASLFGGRREGEDEEDPTMPPHDPPPSLPKPEPPPPGTDPVWPLATLSRTVSTDFGDPRPFGSPNPTRHHAGEDLRAPRGTVVYAPEAGAIVKVLPTWYKSKTGKCIAGALLLETSHFVLNLGEVEGWQEFGIQVGSVVLRGGPVARVGCTGMLHFEVYKKGTRRTHRWPWKGSQPEPLIDPTDYLVAAGGIVKG